jgi:VWFA-related protein
VSIAAGFVLAAAAPQLAAQDAAPQRFKSSVDLVQVDVSAVDDAGRPIPDLTAKDFVLRVDGRARPIVAAQFIKVPLAAEAPRPAPPVYYSSNANTTGGRLIMIAVDRTSIATGRAKAALEAASRFVSTLNPADRLALATIPNGPQVPWTADHELVQRLITTIEGTAIPSFGNRNIGITDALAFERRNTSRMADVFERECGLPNSGGNQRGGSSEVVICQGEVQSEALLVAADARDRSRRTVNGLQSLLDGFPPSNTPKILAFISEGLVTQGEPSPLKWLDAKAAAAHVTIYPLHIEASGADASQRRPQTNTMEDRTIQEQGLAMLASATGGDMFRIVSNSDFAFQRLSSELTGYYLLGFEPDTRERNGLPHAISVEVKRKGITVRSRRQFTIPINNVKTTEELIVSTLRDPLPSSEIGIKVTTYSFRDPRSQQLRLFVAADIDRSINPDGEFSVGYVIVDFDGKLITSQMDSALPRPEPEHKATQRYFSYAPVDPGKYTLKLVVVDDAGRRGSVERVIEPRLTEAGPIRATDLIIGEGADRGWALPVAPSVTGEITKGTLYSYLELFGETAETFARSSVTLEIQRPDGSAPILRVPVQLDAPKLDGECTCRVAPARVRLSDLPPGDYVARAVIAMGLESVGQVSRPFRIAPK